ncbi:MAG: pilus assembly PilX N-terminal domain-containing protein [bacterium]
MNFNDEEGFALVLGIIVLGALIILVFSMTDMIDMDLSFYRQNRDSTKAFFAAESGINYGTQIFTDYSSYDLEDLYSDTESEVYELSSTDDLSAMLDNASVESIEWQYKLIDDLPGIEFTAYGESRGQQETIKAQFILDAYDDVYNNVIAAGDKISIKNNHILTDGDITTTKDIDGTFMNEDDEEIEANVDKDFVVPEFDYDDLKDRAENEISPESGDIDFDDITDYDPDDSLVTRSDVSNKFTYIDGDLNINTNQDINGSGVIVVDGKLTIGNNIRINQTEGYEDEYLTIIVSGKGSEEGVVLEGDNKIQMQGLLYSAGNTDFGNQLSLTGALLSGGTLDLINSDAASKNINYDPGFIEKILFWDLYFEDEEYEEIKGVKDMVDWQEQ